MRSKVLISKSHIKIGEIISTWLSYILKEFYNFLEILLRSQMEEHTSLYNIRVIFFFKIKAIQTHEVPTFHISIFVYEFKSLSQPTAYQNRENYLDVCVIHFKKEFHNFLKVIPL